MDKLTAAQNLAAGLFANPELFPDVSAITNSQEQPEGPCRELFEIFEQLRREGKDVSLENVAARIGGDLKTEIVRYSQVCLSISSENVLYYAQQVHLRAAAEALGPLLINAGYDLAMSQTDVLQTLTGVRGGVEEAIQGFSTGDTAKSWQDCLLEFLAEVQSAKTRYHKTGFGNLDSCVGGYCAGDLDIVAARSGGGKTDIAVSMAVKAAKAGVPVLYESLELYRVDITGRAVSDASGVRGARIRDKNLEQEHYDMIEAATDALYQIKGLTVDAPSRLTVQGLEAMIAKHRPQVVFIDNLDLISPEKSRQEKWRQNEETCHALKALAKRSKTCIVGLVQLNRTTDTYGDDKAPMMSDLYGGSAIEHDASWIVALKPGADAHQVNAHILKSRAGRSGGKVSFLVDFDLHRWREMETRYE